MSTLPIAANSSRTVDDFKKTPGLIDLRSGRVRRICFRFMMAWVALGAIGRIKQYIARPSYWNDEAAVVSNVVHRNCVQLLDRLDYAQAAPPLFLWIERGLFRAFGASEYSLRSFPLFCSLLLLILYARLAWRLLPATSAVWAVAWLSLFQKILHHGIDVKQYPSDVCVSIALLLIVFGRNRTVSSARRMIELSIASAVGLWLSFPVVFLFGALSVVLLPSCWKEGKNSLIAAAGGGLMVLISFAVLSRIAMSHGPDPFLIAFWHASFPDLQRPLTIPFWMGREVYGLFAYPFDSFGGFTAALAMLGSIAMVKLKQGRLLAVLPVALGLAFVAAAMQKYPFPGRNRMGLYLVPIALLILGAGAEGQNLNAPPGLCKWWWLLPAPLLVLELGQCIKDLGWREEESTTRPVVEYMQAARRTSEPIYLFGDSLNDSPASGRSAELLCYWPEPPGKVVVGYVDPARIAERRFWAVYSLNRPDTDKPPFTAKLKAIFGPRAHVVREYQPGRQSGAMLIERD